MILHLECCDSCANPFDPKHVLATTVEIRSPDQGPERMLFCSPCFEAIFNPVYSRRKKTAEEWEARLGLVANRK